jgi:hypothetical protein
MTTPQPLDGPSARAYDRSSGRWMIHWLDSRTPAFGDPYAGTFVNGRGDFYRTWTTPRRRADRPHHVHRHRRAVRTMVAVRFVRQQSHVTDQLDDGHAAAFSLTRERTRTTPPDSRSVEWRRLTSLLGIDGPQGVRTGVLESAFSCAIT